MMLELFCSWAQQTLPTLPATCQARLSLGQESPNRAARFDLDTPGLAGRITCWDSGDFHAEVIDLQSGINLLSQHGTLAPESAPLPQLQAFLAALGIARYPVSS